ncbi:Golgi apyrase [Podosphaera aphanis]|nr:Golgi apyrase [Podosphaera aphanis]
MGKWRWGVILDAGSSGTRVHVYRWLNPLRARQEATGAELSRLPDVHTKPEYTKKILPGVSSFAENPLDIGPKHLQGLLDHALSIVPENQVTDTPIFLMATAGVRLLEPSKQRALLDEICAYAQQHSNFSLPDCDLHIQVISGETEGLYGWIAVNYLLKSFDAPQLNKHGSNHHTYGLLEMGGASAQIAFAPNATETEKHANDLKLLRLRSINGDASEYKVFTATWLGFGVNQARERYVQSLLDASYTTNVHEILDPCLPSGLRTTIDGRPVMYSPRDITLLGTGLFDECLRKTYPLLDKDAPCTNQPCLLHGQHVPVIDWSINHFVGVSEYWHTTHGVFDLEHVNNKYNALAYKNMAMSFCSEEWDDIERYVEKKVWGSKVDAKIAQEVCFKASWIINVLHEGIGMPQGPSKYEDRVLNSTTNSSAISTSQDHALLDPFQAVDTIDKSEVTWTLGKMILYAAGQIPPSASVDAPAPVGFGPNLAGPEFFQEAGSDFRSIPSIDDENSWTEAAEELVEKAHYSPPSMNSLVFFILILIFVGYLFRKRDLRLRLSRLVRNNRRSSSLRSKGRSFFYSGGNIFGSRSSIIYDKVLEEGAADTGFDLGEAESDDNEYSESSNSSRIGRTSGLATPNLIVINVDPGAPYFDTTCTGGGPGEGKGLGITNSNAFHRAGLAARTESRDRSSLGQPAGGAARPKHWTDNGLSSELNLQ